MDVTLLRRVVSTLNAVEVRGKDNLDMLLCCIQALEKFIDNAEEEVDDG